MMKKTYKDIAKMRTYIEQHTTACDPSSDEVLLEQF